MLSLYLQVRERGTALHCLTLSWVSARDIFSDFYAM